MIGSSGKENIGPGDLHPFQFMTETGVVLWTGYIADDLSSLLRGLRQVTGSSIYYHVHHAVFRRPRYTWGEYTNDFARWTLTTLGQKALAERLSSVDPLRFPTIRQCREQLSYWVQAYVGEEEVFQRVPTGRELYFLEARSMVVPTGSLAHNVRELAACIQGLGPSSILYHFIESRFGVDGDTNHFSQWLRLRGEVEKAEALERLNPFFYDLESLKAQIVAVLRG